MPTFLPAVICPRRQVCRPPCPHKAPLFSRVVSHLGHVTLEVGVQAETGMVPRSRAGQ